MQQYKIVLTCFNLSLLFITISIYSTVIHECALLWDTSLMMCPAAYEYQNAIIATFSLLQNRV